MALPIRDHLKHLAGIDAAELAEAYRTIPSRRWDGMANRAWYDAAADAGCLVTDAAMRSAYLAALVAECQRLADLAWQSGSGR